MGHRDMLLLVANLQVAISSIYAARLPALYRDTYQLSVLTSSDSGSKKFNINTRPSFVEEELQHGGLST